MGLQSYVVKAVTSQGIDDAFAAFGRERPDAVFVASDAFFARRRVQLAILAAKYGIPATYSSRDYPEVGGLMSYGTNLNEGYRQVGIYTGQILKGAKASALPVLQLSTFELVINLQTAKSLGIIVPPTLLARTDEVIE
jgi:putative ABC transport system substrate-binding protein